MKHLIVGTGGCAKDFLVWATDSGIKIDGFVGQEKNMVSFMDLPVVLVNDVCGKSVNLVIAIGDPQIREKIIQDELKGHKYFFNIIHPKSIVCPQVDMGFGNVICPGAIVSVNTKLGNHCQINLNSIVGHDSVLGDYFTTAVNVSITGNTTAGNCVYFGSNSTIKEKLVVCDNVKIGMGACVVKNVTESGTYVGVPAQRIGHE